MHFSLIDKVTHVEAGIRIRATKALSIAEEYLRDHFPLFPVMPGVLMLEAMYETSAWLVRHTEDFQHSAVLLAEARNIKYADFVQPGRLLEVSAEILKQDERTTTLKASGEVEGHVAVSGRLILERFQISQRWDVPETVDEIVKAKLRRQFQALYRPVSSKSESPATVTT
jgi:3-hydroxyacyl-[acyl-carrier-protein] dehydratase